MLTYDDFVKTAGPQIDAAYRQARGHAPATADQFHNAWRLLREGWDITDVLADIRTPGSVPYGGGKHPEEMAGYVPPAPPESGFLSVAGRIFRDDQGQPWPFAGYHAHLLLPVMAKGIDIRPRIVEAREYGANTIIVIGCHLSPWKRDNGFFYDPRDPSHPDRLAALFDTAAQEGMRVCYKVLADAHDLSVGEQRALWVQAGDLARGRWNVLLSLGNEGESNDWNPANFGPLVNLGGVLQSKGDKNGDQTPYVPVWDFAEFESRRDLPKALTDASCTELFYGWDGFPGIQDRPIVNIEPAFFSDTDPDKWGDHRWTDPALALSLGLYIGAGCAGGGFGASDGMEGLPLQPRAAECARQFFRGLRASYVR